MIQPDEIIKTLIEKNLLTPEQAEGIKTQSQASGKSIDEVLLNYDQIDQEELTDIKAEILSLPVAHLLDEKISENALNLIPKEVAENYKIICFEKEYGQIKIGMIDPENFKAIEAINFLAKEESLKPVFYIISPQSFEKARKQYTTLKKEVNTALETKAQEEELEKKNKKAETETVEEVIKSAPVAKIVSVIIRHAVEGGASDIHIEPLYKESRVRYRIDGVLHTSLVLPKNIHPSIIARIKVLANLKLDETRIPQDGRISMVFNNKDIDFRVSCIPLMQDEKIVMRILDVTRGAPTLEELGYSNVGLEIVNKNIKFTNGMFLVTGPTGSGKSTTLFSVLNLINKEGINISTLEDPVEYYVKGVNQSQIRAEVGYTFATGLRSLLRQDPDVIMVGEIRDSETAELAIHASLTGHFVLSTLHTNSALGAIPRLIDMKVEPFLLGSTLTTVIAQRLVRLICKYCKTELKLPAEILEDVKKEIAKVPKKVFENIFKGKKIDLDKTVFYKGEGCNRCGNTGYSGRICVAEVIDINDAIRNMIMENKIISQEDVMSSQDYITMKQDAYIKGIQGLTTLEEALRVIRE
jgi:type IV pilus assembly protein PilB